MDKKYYSVEEVERMLDFADRKERFRNTLSRNAQRIGAWINRNKEMIILFTPVIVGAGTTLFRVVSKNVNLRKEKAVKDLYCYDRSLGHYWALRRELKNSEWVEIDKRKANGERLADILSEMKVLK